MSTRSYIAIKENGIYQYIYNHCDSYIDKLGIMLYHHYSDINKLKELISLGNTGSIYSKIENTANSYAEHLGRPAEERGTVFQWRERMWEPCGDMVEWDECKPNQTEDISELFVDEYVYIFDTEDNKWYMATWMDNYQLWELEKVLHSREILETMYSDIYREEYLPEFYEKCLNA